MMFAPLEVFFQGDPAIDIFIPFFDSNSFSISNDQIAVLLRVATIKFGRPKGYKLLLGDLAVGIAINPAI